MKKMVSMRLEQWVIDDLDRLAKEKGVSKSKVLEYLLIVIQDEKFDANTFFKTK